jgi:hypothetical protein
MCSTTPQPNPVRQSSYVRLALRLRGTFSFAEGVSRWHNRVVAYALTLVADQYPPFRLAP